MLTASSTRLRYLTFWLARLWGYVYWWLLSGWRPFALSLIMVAFGVWLAEQAAVHFHLFNVKPGEWFQIWNILAIYAIFGILAYAWQARKRIVVEEFVDYAATDPSKPLAKGLATLLVIKLAQLRELYQSVDEQRAIQTDVGINSSLDATINVEDISGFLKGAVSPESTLKLGPIAIPVGNLMSLISRLVQGSRITGSLHRSTKEGKPILILTVQKVGGTQIKSWQADSEIISSAKQGEPEKYRFDDMVMELAYHIFTDLELGGKVGVKALSAFSEGLQAYRDCLRLPIDDRKPNLKQAQRKLIEALAKDINFDVAYYNLGIIYSELDQTQAAEVTFLEAINRNPHAWQTYYALMVNRFQCEQNKSVIQLGERVIDLKPGRLDLAKAYNLIGLARRRLNDLSGAIENNKRAAFHAWKAICKFERSRHRTVRTMGSALPHQKIVVSICLANLAVAYGYRVRTYNDEVSKSVGLRERIAKFQRWYTFRRAKALFRQALFLDRSNADFYFELGKLCYERQKYNLAISAYKHATQICPERIEFWAHLALAYARLKRPDMAAALNACQKILDNASYAFETAPDAFEKMKEAYNWLGSDGQEQGRPIAVLPAFLHELKKDIQQGGDAISSLQEKLISSELKHNLWECAQISWALGQVYLNIGDPKLAEMYFLKAIEKFETIAPSEIRLRRLRALLARSLLNQGKFEEALREAEKALSLDPLNSFEHEVLGDVYFELHEFERAIDAWQKAILRRYSETYIIYFKIGIAYLQLAQQCHTSKRATLYQKATTSLEQVFDLCETDQQELKAKASYFLGSIHLEKGAYEEAISCFRISSSLGFSPKTSTLYLAYAYLKNKEFDASTDLLQSLRTGLEEAKRGGQLNIIPGMDTSNEELPLDEILVMTYCGLAFSYAERDIRLSEGLKFINTAQQYMNTLDQEKLKEFHSPASCLDCKGWLLTKQGKTDEAIKCLEQALALTTEAETYWHLAMAYARKLQNSSKDDLQSQFLSTQIKVYCQHVHELDLNGEFEQRRQDLLQYLEERDQHEQQGNAQKQTASLANDDASIKAAK